MSSSTNLMVRLDEESKSFIAKAAELRQISISDYVRMITVAQARREVTLQAENVIALPSDEQLAFWNALNQPVRLTEAQQGLSATMRGET